MPMPDAYQTRAKAFFDRGEKIDAPDIRALLTRWKRTGSRVLELGCGSGRDACHIASLGADVTACDGSSLPERAQALAGSRRSSMGSGSDAAR